MALKDWKLRVRSGHRHYVKGDNESIVAVIKMPILPPVGRGTFRYRVSIWSNKYSYPVEYNFDKSVDAWKFAKKYMEAH